MFYKLLSWNLIVLCLKISENGKIFCFSLIFERQAWLFIVEMPVVFVRLIYQNTALVGLELEVPCTVLGHIHEYGRKHLHDEVGTGIAIIAVLGAQTLTYVPYEVTEVNSSQLLFKADRHSLVSKIFRPFLNLLTEFLQFLVVIDKKGRVYIGA